MLGDIGSFQKKHMTVYSGKDLRETIWGTICLARQPSNQPTNHFLTLSTMSSSLKKKIENFLRT